MKIDLDRAEFTQGQVLALVPDSKAKTLQNWNDLDLIAPGNPKPGRHGRRLYSGVGIVSIAFMVDVAGLGLRPGIARELAAAVRTRTLLLHEKYPAKEGEGRLHWTIAGSNPELYARGHIFKLDGRHVLWVDDDRESFELCRPLLPRIYVTVELDYLILVMLNRIYALLAGVDVTKSMEGADSSEGRQWLEVKKKISKPGW